MRLHIFIPLDNRPYYMVNNTRNVHTPSIRRLTRYLRFLRAAKTRGVTVVSCSRIAESFNLSPVLVRRDLSFAGVLAAPKQGYRVNELIEDIEQSLGWDHKTHALLVGAGNLGSAIVKYNGFREQGLNIAGIFDSDPNLHGTLINGHKVFSFEKIVEYVKGLKSEYGISPDVGIITVPADSAQEVADKLIEVGVRAIWNYAPARLSLPENIVCESVSLCESFAILTHQLQMQDSGATFKGHEFEFSLDPNSTIC